MKAVIQRVKHTSLFVEKKLISEIDFGLTVYLCIVNGDTLNQADYFVKKLVNMRIFSDENDKMNLSVKDVGGQIMLVSQFTLCADASHGNRPSYINAARPEFAIPMYEYVKRQIAAEGITVKCGVFGADMQIAQLNDGPVTIPFEC